MTQAQRQFGKLFLVPAPLDFGCDEDIDLQQVMPMGTISAAANITH
jgi:16S rRNA (cytidine1402-2'-O)-methyltransferase